MAPTIEQVIQGLETRLATISGLRTNEITPDSGNFPLAFVGVPSWDRETMAKGKFTLPLTITVLTSRALDRVGQLQLASYANLTGTSSILVAVEGDPTLGGVVDDCKVLRFRPLDTMEIAGIGAYGGLFELLAACSGV
jgi:hypothetical protein